MRKTAGLVLWITLALVAACNDDRGSGVCHWLGEVHPVGETFTHSDMCNRCMCVSSENVECTLAQCPIDVLAPPVDAAPVDAPVPDASAAP